MTYTNYDIDGWYVSLPQNWQMSLDKEQQPPQIIFEVPEEPVTIYISTWDFQRPETGELAGREILASFVLRTFEMRNIARLTGYDEYYPQGFDVYMGKSMTADNYLMISCFLCTEGSMFSFYIVCGEGVDFEKYLQYLKMIERN